MRRSRYLGMNEKLFSELSTWLTQAGLAGTAETDIFSGFCDRCVAAGIPLGRAHLFIDTLHPVHEGRLFRWGFGPNEPPVHEYGRTSLERLDVSGPVSLDVQATDVWRRSPFYNMLQTGASLLRRRLDADTKDEFSMLPDWLAAGMTDYVAIITRFAAEGVIGEMDAVYSSWGTPRPDGFSDAHIATLERIAPYLALAIKSVSLARMTKTLMETYLGRDAGQRVLSGRIMRGNAEQIDAVVWFSDLRGFTRITDTAPEQVIPLLNDYSDVIVSAIHDHGGDVLKLIGDGTLAIFTAENRMQACNAALAAAIAARQGVAKLKTPRYGRKAVNRHVSRFACRQGLLWQCRKPGAAGLYRTWTSRKRGKPHCGDVPFGRAARSNIGGVCRGPKHETTAGFGGTVRATRRIPPPGTVYARP
jgi:adenylate cyclase